MLTPKCSQPVKRLQAHLIWNTALLSHQEGTTDIICAPFNMSYWHLSLESPKFPQVSLLSQATHGQEGS